MIKTIMNEGKKVGFTTVEVFQEVIQKHEFEHFVDYNANHEIEVNKVTVRAFAEQGDPVGFMLSDPNLKSIRTAFANIYSAVIPVKKQNWASQLPSAIQPVKLNIFDESLEQVNEKSFLDLIERINEILVSFPKLVLKRIFFCKSFKKTYLANTNQLQGKYKKSIFNLSLQFMMNGNFMEISDYKLYFQHLEPFKMVSRAYNLLNSLTRSPYQGPAIGHLLLAPEAASTILKEFSEAFKLDANGSTSFKMDFPAILNIVDHPLLDMQVGSAPFDDEGVQSQEKYLLRKGVFNQYVSDIQTAFRQQATSTGNGYRDQKYFFPTSKFANLYFQATILPVQNLMREAKRGVLVSLIKLKSVDDHEYLYSAYGYTFENEDIGEPVHFYFKTSLTTFFLNIIKISKELKFFYSNFNVGSPYVLVAAKLSADDFYKV